MYEILSKCAIFNGVQPDTIAEILLEADCSIKEFSQGDVVVLQGGHCKSLMILVAGKLAVEKTDKKRKTFRIEEISAPSVLLPAFVYAVPNIVPVSIIAAEVCEVLFIDREKFSDVLRGNDVILRNYLSVLSNNGCLLSDKITFLAFKTIKSKFAHFLFDQSAAAGDLSFRLNITQREMADMFGVTRPALARAIGEMSDDGAIYVDCKNITILYPEKLKQYL